MEEARLREQKELREREERESQEPSMKLARFRKKLDMYGQCEPELDIRCGDIMKGSAYMSKFRDDHQKRLMNALRPPRQLYPFSSMAMAMRDQPSMYAPLVKAQLVRRPNNTPKHITKLKTMDSLRTMLIDRLIPPEEFGKYGKHNISKGGMHKSRSKTRSKSRSKCRSKSKSKCRG
jgi:hypothetical protein